MNQQRSGAACVRGDMVEKRRAMMADWVAVPEGRQVLWTELTPENRTVIGSELTGVSARFSPSESCNREAARRRVSG
jgi:hypothetical protein